MIHVQDGWNSLTTEATASTAVSQKWALVPWRNAVGVPSFVFTVGEYQLGSAEDCDWQLSQAGVSEYHCRLICQEHRVTVIAQDLRTWINEGPVRKAVLKPGDRLTIGPLNFRLAEAPAESPTEAPAEARTQEFPPFDQNVLNSLQQAVRQGRLQSTALEWVTVDDPHNQAGVSAGFSTEEMVTPQETDQILSEIQESVQQSLEQLQRHTQALQQLPEVPHSATAAACHEPLPIVSASTHASASINQTPSPEQLTSREAELDRRERQLNLRLNRLASLRERLRSLQESRRQQLAYSHSQLEQKLAACAERERRLQERELRERSIEKRLQEQQTAAAERLQQMTAELETLQSLVAESEQNEIATRESLLQLQQQLTEQTSQLTAEVESLTTSLQQTEAERVRFEAELQTEQQKRLELEIQLQTAQEQQTHWQQMLQDREMEWESHHQEAQQEWSQLQLQLQSRLAETTEHNQQQREELQRLQEEKQFLAQELELLRDQLEEKETGRLQQEEEWEKLSQEREHTFEIRERLEEERAAFGQTHQELLEVRRKLDKERLDWQSQKLEWTQQQRDLQEQKAALQQAQAELDQAWAQLEQTQKSWEDQRQREQETRQAATDLMAEPAQKLDNLQLESEKFTASQLSRSTNTKQAESLQTESSAESAEETDDSAFHFDFHSLENILHIPDSEPEAVTESTEVDAEVNLTANPDLSADQNSEEDGAKQTTPEVEKLSAEAQDAEEMNVSDWLRAQQLQFTDESERETSGSNPQSPRPWETENHAEGVRNQSDHSHQGDHNDQSDQSEEDSDDQEGLGKLRRELAEMFGYQVTSRKSSLSASDDRIPAAAAENPSKSVFSEQLSSTSPLMTNSLFEEKFQEKFAPQAADTDTDEEQLEEESEQLVATEEPESEGTAGPGEPLGMVVEDIEDANSVAAYMERLFARTGGRQEYQTSQTAPRASATQLESPKPASALQATSVKDPDALVGPPTAQSNLVPDKPIDVRPPISPEEREMMKREIESLRDVANQTARHALATHAWKQIRIKIMASGILTFVSGATAATLLTSPLWSPVSYFYYGLVTLALTAVSVLELFRSRWALIRLKQGKKTYAAVETFVSGAASQLAAAAKSAEDFRK